MSAPYPALKCWTCRHRKVEEEGGYSAAVGIKVHKCREFINSKTGPLHCGYAYDRFCRGLSYKPTLLTRLINFFGGKS